MSVFFQALANGPVGRHRQTAGLSFCIFPLIRSPLKSAQFVSIAYAGLTRSVERLILFGCSIEHKVLDLERTLIARITPWNPI